MWLNLPRATLAGVGHHDRVSLLHHLGELRIRLVVSGVALIVAFGLAFWQNHALLDVLNRPLERATAGALKHSRGPLAQSARVQQSLRVALDRQRAAFELLARSSGPLNAAQRRALCVGRGGDLERLAQAAGAKRRRHRFTKI